MKILKQEIINKMEGGRRTSQFLHLTTNSWRDVTTNFGFNGTKHAARRPYSIYVSSASIFMYTPNFSSRLMHRCCCAVFFLTFFPPILRRTRSDPARPVSHTLGRPAVGVHHVVIFPGPSACPPARLTHLVSFSSFFLFSFIVRRQNPASLVTFGTAAQYVECYLLLLNIQHYC